MTEKKEKKKRNIANRKGRDKTVQRNNRERRQKRIHKREEAIKRRIEQKGGNEKEDAIRRDA